MPMAEITIIPLGSGTSVSRFVAKAVEIPKRKGLKFKVTPTSTVIEGDLDVLFEVLKEMHEAPFKEGIKRVVTVIKIDDRRDKDIDMDYKVQAVLSKLGSPST